MKKKLTLFLLLSLITVISFNACKSKDDKKIKLKEKEKIEKQSSDKKLNNMKIDELTVAAYDGNSEAALVLGKKFDFGINENQNFYSALKWYKKADALKNKKAAVHIGYLYMNGLGTDKNLSVAKDYFKKAIKEKDIDGALIGGASLDTAKFKEIYNKVILTQGV